MIHLAVFSSYFPSKNKNYQYGVISPVQGPDGAIVDTTITYYGQDTDLDYNAPFGNQATVKTFAGMLHYSHSFGNNKLKAMLLALQSTDDFDGVNNVDHRRKLAANVHYGINDTYFFDVAASYSGRNLLPEGDRYHFFPAVSAAWLLS